MQNISNYLSYLPKRIVGLAVLAILVAVPVLSVQASTPTPPMFNIYDGVNFGGENIGDESDFLRVGPVNSSFNANHYSNSHEVCDGQADLWVYIHNGQSSVYNGNNNNGVGVANDTKVEVNLPTGVSNSHNPTATISASNAANITDGATLTCNGEKVSLSYVSGSAKGYSQQRGEFAISDSIVGNGTDIGTFANDGVVPGCWEFRIWVKLTVEVNPEEKPSMEAEKQVRLLNSQNPVWTENVSAEPGDQVEFRIAVKNTGNIDLVDVVVTDVTPPAGMTVDPNSVSVTGGGATKGGGDLFAGGLVLNKVEAGQTTYVTFTATVDEEAFECEAHRLVNTAIVFDDRTGAKEDTASVTGDWGECDEPFFACDSIQTVVNNETLEATFTVNTSSSDDVTVESYTYNFGDDSDELTTDQNSTTHKYEEKGEYTVTVTVAFNVNEEVVEVECSDEFTVGTGVLGASTLPNTGPAAAFAGLFGTGTLAMAIRSWTTSRNSLRAKLLGQK